MDGEYGALVEKISGFTANLATKLAEDMACRAGCDGCCQVWLAPSQVEADTLRAALAQLSPEARGRIAARGRREIVREATGKTPRCALLDDEGHCEAYAARPLVCRTQGHALLYPTGIIPAGAVRRRLPPRGEVTACELNFERALPAPELTVDAERIDQLLALINRRYCEARGFDPLTRHPISSIAAECDVLASAPA